MRIARVGDTVYVDLADDAWRAVEVTKTGWRVIDRPPVRFRRTAGMLPLPVPQEGGDVNALKDFLNIDDDGFLLAVAWQLAALGGIGPYPILCLYGEHGAAKTSGDYNGLPGFSSFRRARSALEPRRRRSSYRHSRLKPRAAGASPLSLGYDRGYRRAAPPCGPSPP